MSFGPSNRLSLPSFIGTILIHIIFVVIIVTNTVFLFVIPTSITSLRQAFVPFVLFTAPFVFPVVTLFRLIKVFDFLFVFLPWKKIDILMGDLYVVTLADDAQGVIPHGISHQFAHQVPPYKAGGLDVPKYMLY